MFSNAFQWPDPAAAWRAGLMQGGQAALAAPEAVEAEVAAPVALEAAPVLASADPAAQASQAVPNTGGEAAERADEPVPFGSNDEAFAYLASVTGFSEEEIRELAEEEPAQFMVFDPRFTLGEADIDPQEWKRELEGLQWKIAGRPQVGSGSRSRGDWATPKIRNDAKRTAAGFAGSPLFPGGAYTVHHKVSRHKLSGLNKAMEGAGSEANPLRHVVDEIGTAVNAGSRLKALLNIPANLEVGPPGDRRLDDPGSEFDGNLAPDGTLTPRSQTLEEVDGLISRNGGIDFAEVAARLESLHRGQRDGAITAPKTGQWKNASHGKFKRK